MTKKKRNSTRKKILTNSQDKNINRTFTETAFFITAKKITETEASCLKIDPASSRVHVRSVKRSNSERRKVYYMKDLVVLKFGMNVLEVPFQ